MNNVEEVWVIKNSKGLYATYGRNSWNKSIRFAKQYKTKKTALRYYFNKEKDYNNLTLVKLQIVFVGEEETQPTDFTENMEGNK